MSIWQVFRRDYNPKKAQKEIEVSNCLTSVAFHPTDPLLLAGGTLNGEIYLWNIDKEEPLVCKSDVDEYYHRESIQSLIWVRQQSMTTLVVNTSLVSCSTDGKILVWRVEDKLRYPVKGHLLARRKGDEMQVIGGTSLDKVSVMEDNTFIVGTEGGALFRCNIGQPSDSDITHLLQAN